MTHFYPADNNRITNLSSKFSFPIWQWSAKTVTFGKKCCEKKTCNKRKDGLALHSGVSEVGNSISIYLVSSSIYFLVRIEELENLTAGGIVARLVVGYMARYCAIFLVNL